MKHFFTFLKVLPIGLAMFSMFFGAGNVIFPVAVGQFAGDKNFIAMIGLILTAVIMPFAGVIAMLLFHGDHRRFFGRLGQMPGYWMAVIIMLLLGPLGSTPRCIALSFSTLQSFLPELSPILFSAAACFAVFLLTMNKKNLLQVLGKILTPFLLLSIAIILFKGLLLPAKPRNVPFSSAAVFWQGLKEGYNTMDLLAAFFFSSTVLRLIKRREEGDNKQSIRIALQASFIGGFLLAAVYIGFSYLASFQGAEFLGASKDKLLNLITLKVAGPYAGLLICLTIALACLTTAVALTSVFADFLQKDIFKDKISYRSSLMYSLFMTFIVANFQFNGISAFLGPILEICYPALIVLTFINLGNKLFQIKSVKAPVYAALAGSIALHLF